MKILVDADACPAVIKDILYRAAGRSGVALVLVANQALRVPASPYISTIQVPRGFDVADQRIAEMVEPGDLVITADIPLAASVIERGGRALEPRGELFTPENIREKLDMRNFMDELRGSGVQTGGPSAFSNGDRHAFAGALDRILHRLDRAGGA